VEADVPLSFFLFVSASFSSPLLSFFPSPSLPPSLPFSLSPFLPFSLFQMSQWFRSLSRGRLGTNEGDPGGAGAAVAVNFPGKLTEHDYDFWLTDGKGESRVRSGSGHQLGELRTCFMDDPSPLTLLEYVIFFNHHHQQQHHHHHQHIPSSAAAASSSSPSPALPPSLLRPGPQLPPPLPPSGHPDTQQSTLSPSSAPAPAPAPVSSPSPSSSPGVLQWKVNEFVDELVSKTGLILDETTKELAPLSLAALAAKNLDLPPYSSALHILTYIHHVSGFAFPLTLPSMPLSFFLSCLFSPSPLPLCVVWCAVLDTPRQAAFSSSTAHSIQC